MRFPPFLYKKYNGDIVQGQFFRALVKHNDNFVLTQLRVYADRTIAGAYTLSKLPIDRLYKHVSKYMPKINKDNLIGMELGSDENINAVPFDDFKFLVKNNIVTQNFKGNVMIEFWDEPFTEDSYMVEIEMKIDNDDFIKSLEDVFSALNDKKTTIRRCMNVLCEFLQAPLLKKELFRKKLQVAYLDVPKHQRSDIFPESLDIEGKTPIDDIIFKRVGAIEKYDDFVRAYGDDYFEDKYKRKKLQKIYN